MNSKELNDLFDYGYMIYQNKEYFKFSVDSVLLAEFVDLKKNQHKILDMCAGNAPISMILSKKYGNKVEITSAELQKEVYQLGKESIEYNKINNINLLNENVLNLPSIYNACFDVITCNPPYFIHYDNKNINDNDVKAIARHELTIDLEGVINVASKCLRNKGYFYLVHRPERLADIANLLDKYNFGFKTLQTVFDNENSRCCFILVEAVYNGKNYVKINRPIYLNQFSSYQGIFKES